MSIKHNRARRTTAEGACSESPAGAFRRRWRRIARDEHGQAVLEFALVLPLLCALVFALVDAGKGVYYYIQLTHVANEGACIATVNPASLPGGSGSLKVYLCSQLGSGTSELRAGSTSVDRATVTVSYPTGTQQIGDPVTVIVSTNYHPIPFFGGGSIHISGGATMRLEQSTAGNGLLASGQC